MPEAQDPEVRPGARPPGEWVSRPVPSISKSWDPLSRWREVLRLRWRVEDHNNIGELRILVLALRRLARTSRAWHKRVLIFSDSMVSIGTLSKGRSGSWSLLRLARMACSVVLACGFKAYYRYVESKRNHADGPSRGFPIGVAPEWVGEQEKELIQRRMQAARRTQSAPATACRTRINMDYFITAG